MLDTLDRNDNEILERLEQATGIKYSDEQRAILSAKGGLAIIAAAGSGKTTVLTHLITKRILSGEIASPNKLLCTTYSKAGADEMSDRLNKLLKRLGVNYNITVKTIHASYYQVLKHFGLLKNICTNAQRKMLIKEACTENKIRLEEDDMNTLDSLLSYQINYLMTDKALVNSYIYTLEDVSEQKYSDIRQSYNKKKEEMDLMDFDDMQLYLYSLMVVQKNQAVIDYCRSQWEYFYVDEFQDTSKIQFAIMRQMVTDPSKIMVIGDDDQCVYQWRGADPTIILNICGYYDIQKYFLNTNYRCGENIVKVAETGIKKMSRRENKEMKAHRGGGKIEVLPASGKGLFNLSLDAYHHIKREMAHGARESEICVLSRNNNHVAILGNLLLRDGIYCTSAEDMKISKLPLFKDLSAVLELSKDTYNANLVRSVLWKCVAFLGIKGGNAVYEFMNATGCSLKNTLGYMLTSYCRRYDVSWSGNIKIGDRVNYKIEAMVSRINYKAIDGLVDIYNILKIEDELARVKKFIEMLKNGSKFMYNTQDRMRTLIGMTNYFQFMCEKYGIEDTEAFLRLTEQYESGKMAVSGETITLSTIHGAKGMEWKYVIQFADDNISFPSFDGICTMLEKGISEKDIFVNIDGERRLHYVAQTRAIEKWTLIADIENISVFTLESMDIIPKYEGSQNNKLIVDLAKERKLPNELKCAIIDELNKESSPYTYSYRKEVAVEAPSSVGVEDSNSEDNKVARNTYDRDDLDVFVNRSENGGYEDDNEFWGVQ